MQTPPLHAGEKAATGRFVGPVRVELDGVVQSVWNFQRLMLLLPRFTMKFGEPDGGAVAPSRSEGSSPPKVELSEKHCCVALWPASICDLSKAHVSAPRNRLAL